MNPAAEWGLGTSPHVVRTHTHAYTLLLEGLFTVLSTNIYKTQGGRVLLQLAFEYGCVFGFLKNGALLPTCLSVVTYSFSCQVWSK